MYLCIIFYSCEYVHDPLYFVWLLFVFTQSAMKTIRKNNKDKKKLLFKQTLLDKKQARWHTIFFFETLACDIYLAFEHLQFKCRTCFDIQKHVCVFIHNSYGEYNGNHPPWYPKSRIRSPLARKRPWHFGMLLGCLLNLLYCRNALEPSSSDTMNRVS